MNINSGQSDTEKIAPGYPVEFTSPLPLTECVSRIQQSYGQRMGMSFAHMEGHIKQIDNMTYEFSLYQHLKNWREIVHGRLIAQSESSTFIKASFTRDESSLWMIIPIIFLAIVTCFAVSTAHGLIALAFFSAVFGLIVYYERKAKSSPKRKPQNLPASELLWYFERTLKH